MVARSAWLRRYAELMETAFAAREASPRLSIRVCPLLHARHPIPAEQLHVLDALEGGRPVPGGVLFRIVRCLLGALRITVLLLILKLRYGRQVAAHLRAPADIVIKTWAFGEPLTEEGADFYFGTLQAQLEARGVRTVILTSDVRRGPSLAFAGKALSRFDRRLVPEWALVPVWGPLAVVADQLISCAVLRRMTARATDPIRRAVCAAAALDVLRTSTTQNALYFHIARVAVRAWRPRALLTLYEGYPWETAVWQGTKQEAPDCRTVGYQHTIIHPYAFGLLRPGAAGGEWAPEIMLCLGEVTRQMLQHAQGERGATLLTFGTLRRAGHPPRDTMPRPGGRTVLVLPEGLREESRLLTEVAVRAAALLPDYHFVLRFHPNISVEAMRIPLESGLSLPANVEFSAGRPIEEDFTRASAVLYRGTSAVLYAILNGLKPFYLDDGQHETDPLFELGLWRERVAGAEQLAAALRAYAQAEQGIMSEWRTAEKYVRSYVTPVDQESLNRLLGTIGLAAGR